MPAITISDHISHRINLRAVSFYLALVGLAYISISVWALINKPLYFYVLAGLPFALCVVAFPRVALYQYLFVLFFELAIIPVQGIWLQDISSLLLISAALLDAFLHAERQLVMPKLIGNYAYFWAAIIVCSLVGYWPFAAFRQWISVTFLIVTFVALFQLLRYQDLKKIMNWFFLLAVFHSSKVIFDFIAMGGGVRSFGFALAIFGHIAEVALPVGVAFWISSKGRKASYFLIGSLIVLGGLIATQSRAPIFFGICTSLFVIFMMKRKSYSVTDITRKIVNRKIVHASLLAVGALGLLLIIKPTLLTSVYMRFEELFTFNPQGTAQYRLILWKNAILAFSENPIFGVGPGGYKLLYQIHPELKLDPTFPYLRIMAAHNLLLHYLAETGIVGGFALIALMIRKYSLALKCWKKDLSATSPVSLALLGWAFIFILSTCIDAAWMYGKLSFLAIFFAALVASHYHQLFSADQTPLSPPR